MSGLVRFRSHDVFESVFHLRDVVPSPVKLADTCHIDGVKEELGFDLEVERRLSSQGWTQVDFHQPRFQVLVDQHVVAQKFKAVVLVCHLLQVRLDLGVDAEQRLQNDVVYA